MHNKRNRNRSESKLAGHSQKLGGIPDMMRLRSNLYQAQNRYVNALYAFKRRFRVILIVHYESWMPNWMKIVTLSVSSAPKKCKVLLRIRMRLRFLLLDRWMHACIAVILLSL